MGPLQGIRVVEIAGLGPGPFAAMLLADMGADVLRIARPGQSSLLGEGSPEPMLRGRTTVTVDLKDPSGVELVLGAIGKADALIEGMRPGVMERLGLGPGPALARNPRLAYARVTGFGQDGPLAQTVGHDINYIAMAGVLGAIAREGERPLAPLNLVGDYGGGGMLAAFGILCAIIDAQRSGRGQVIDAAMVDGAALLTTLIHGLIAGGQWADTPGTNVLDSGAPFYDVYETADHRHVAVGALEPRFYAALLELLQINPALAPQWDRARWPDYRSRFAAVFRTRTRDEWTRLASGTEACVTPVLSLKEATRHEHAMARDAFIELDGVQVPAPAPRFTATPARPRTTGGDVGLERWDFSEDQLAALGSAGPAVTTTRER